MLVILGLVSAIALPRFFTPDTFAGANARASFQSGLSFARNRAVTTQCTVEVRIETDGWSAWRDDDGPDECDSDSPPACPLNFTTALADAGSTASLGGDLAVSSGVQRLIFTPRGRLYRLTSGSGCTDLTGSDPVAAGTTVTLAGGETLRLDGATGYAQLQ